MNCKPRFLNAPVEATMIGRCFNMEQYYPTANVGSALPMNHSIKMLEIAKSDKPHTGGEVKCSKCGKPFYHNDEKMKYAVHVNYRTIDYYYHEGCVRIVGKNGAEVVMSEH